MNTLSQTKKTNSDIIMRLQEQQGISSVFMQRCLLVEFMLTSVVFFNSLTVSKVESFKEITNIQR